MTLPLLRLYADRPARRLLGVAIASVGLIACLALAGANSGPVFAAASNSCPTMRVFGVRGSGETASEYGGYGETVYDAVQEIYAGDPSAEATAINYEAISTGFLRPSYYSTATRTASRPAKWR